MLGLIMMSVPLGIAVGLSMVALARAEPERRSPASARAPSPAGNGTIDDGRCVPHDGSGDRSGEYGQPKSMDGVRATRPRLKEVL